MKILKYISALCLSLLAFSACDSDLDKVYYNENEVTPSVLSDISDSYALDANKASSTAIEFEWTKPQAGYASKIINTLQMDLKGKDFRNAITLYSSTDKGPYAITTKDLNVQIQKLFQAYKMEVEVQPYDFELRISSSISDAVDSFYSNVVATTIIPFIGEPEYPKVYLPGGYCGWADPDNSFGQCQVLYSANDDGIYEGWIVFDGKAEEGWKVTPEASWNVSWGYDATTPLNPEVITVATDTENIKCFDKFSYKFSFNEATLELSVKASAESWGVCGAHNGWGNDVPDTPMTLSFDTDASGKREYYLTATVDFKTNDTWKIRADNGWASQFNASSVEGEFEEAGSDDNFKVSKDGSYIIKLYFNKIKAKLIVMEE